MGRIHSRPQYQYHNHGQHHFTRFQRFMRSCKRIVRKIKLRMRRRANHRAKLRVERQLRQRKTAISHPPHHRVKISFLPEGKTKM